MMQKTGLVALAGALALLVVLAPALAQEPGDTVPSRAEQAIAKGKAAVSLYEQGQWQQALALFIEADALYHSPVLALYAARSQRHLGRLLEARKMYRALAAESVDPPAPESWKKAQIDGTAELQALAAEIPRVTVIVKAAPKATLTVDGKGERIAQPIELDPGSHRIVVQDAGLSHDRKVTLQKSERRRVTFDLTPPAPTGPNVPGVVLTSIGGAAVIAGAIMGGVALSRAKAVELPPNCIERSCLPSDQAAVDESYAPIKTLAAVSDGFLFGGAAMVVAGVVLLIVDPGKKEATSNVAALRF